MLDWGFAVNNEARDITLYCERPRSYTHASLSILVFSPLVLIELPQFQTDHSAIRSPLKGVLVLGLCLLQMM